MLRVTEGGYNMGIHCCRKTVGRYMFVSKDHGGGEKELTYELCVYKAKAPPRKKVLHCGLEVLEDSSLNLQVPFLLTFLRCL